MLPRARHAADTCAAELELGHGSVVILADPRACDRPWQAVESLRQFAVSKRIAQSAELHHKSTRTLEGDSDGLIEMEVYDTSDCPPDFAIDDNDMALRGMEGGNAATAGSSQGTDSVTAMTTATMGGVVLDAAGHAGARIDRVLPGSRENRLDLIADQQRLEWVADVLASVLEKWTAQVGLVSGPGQEDASWSGDRGVGGVNAHDHAGIANASTAGGVGVNDDAMASLRKQWRRTCRAWRSVSGASAVDYGEANDGVAMLCVVTCLQLACRLHALPDNTRTSSCLTFARGLSIDNLCIMCDRALTLCMSIVTQPLPAWTHRVR